MNSQRAWYLLVIVLAVAPVGVRVWTWGTKPKAVDASMAQAGEVLFKHDWTPNDPLCNGGDGLGPVFNATSCLACHRQGGVGGAGGLEHNVTSFSVRSRLPNGKTREGVVHARAVKHQDLETLAQVSPELPQFSQPSLDMLVSMPRARTQRMDFPHGVHISQRNTPALFGAKLIDEVPDRLILANERTQRLKWGMAPTEGDKQPVGRARRLPGGRVGKFGWKAQTASLSDFVQAACANELGLGNPGQPQPRSLGNPGYQAPGLDLTLEQCDQLTTFVASLPKPVERPPAGAAVREQAASGRKLFGTIGCADCHTPDTGPAKGVYSDLLLHRMGQALEGGGSYGGPPPELPDPSPGDDGPLPDEWRTPPLWGVADSAPYLHDGRAATLAEAIELHDGQGAAAAQRFRQLGTAEQAELVAFLQTLRAP
jgi:CxxC motif-containing protein (DUF1111 family)